MRSIDILRLAMRIFKHNKLRTFLTVLGVGIGIAAILFLVSLGYGIQQLTVDKIASLDSIVTLEATTGDSSILEITNDTLDKFKSIKNVVEVSPLINISGQAVYANSTGDVVVNGVEPDYFRLEGLTMMHGNQFTKDDEDSVVVSTAVLSMFGINPNDALSQRIKFSYFNTVKDGSKNETKLEEDTTEYKIVGVINDDGSSYVYLPLGKLAYLNISNYYSAKIKVNNVSNIDQVKSDVASLGYNVTAVADTLDQMNKIFQIVRIVLGALGIIALIVASIGMFNTMTISLLERTREIGIMKSLGAGNFDVWKLFLTEAIMIGFLGGVIGTIIGWSLGKIVNFGINILATSLGGEKVNLFVTPLWFVISIIAFSFFVGFFTGIYPAKRAAKINPLEALRYE